MLNKNIIATFQRNERKNKSFMRTTSLYAKGSIEKIIFDADKFTWRFAQPTMLIGDSLKLRYVI